MRVTEGKAIIDVKLVKTVSKDMNVFYNPVMELNRTISIALLNSIDKTAMQIALPLAGSGVRGIRLLKELDKGKIKNLTMNDLDKKAVFSIKKNLKLNRINEGRKVKIENQDANLFLLNSTGFDYIDIDPFGNPNFLLESSVKRLSRGGVLGVSATDTSLLSGTYPKACKRQYWAKPIRNSNMHEIGIRILIRRVQLIGAQYDKALTPIFSISTDHYMKVFFSCVKGKSRVDEIIKKHGEFDGAGPMWLGELWDSKLTSKMYKLIPIDIMGKINDESKTKTIGFYHIPAIVKGTGMGMPKQEKIITELMKKNFKVSVSHFKENSIRSDISKEGLKKLIQQILKRK